MKFIHIFILCAVLVLVAILLRSKNRSCNALAESYAINFGALPWQITTAPPSWQITTAPPSNALIFKACNSLYNILWKQMNTLPNPVFRMNIALDPIQVPVKIATRLGLNVSITDLGFKIDSIQKFVFVNSDADFINFSMDVYMGVSVGQIFFSNVELLEPLDDIIFQNVTLPFTVQMKLSVARVDLNKSFVTVDIANSETLDIPIEFDSWVNRIINQSNPYPKISPAFYIFYFPRLAFLSFGADNVATMMYWAVNSNFKLRERLVEQLPVLNSIITNEIRGGLLNEPEVQSVMSELGGTVKSIATCPQQIERTYGPAPVKTAAMIKATETMKKGQALYNDAITLSNEAQMYTNSVSGYVIATADKLKTTATDLANSTTGKAVQDAAVTAYNAVAPAVESAYNAVAPAIEQTAVTAYNATVNFFKGIFG